MKIPTNSESLQVKVYPILVRAVEEGVGYGWSRAHKHADNPDSEHVISTIEDAVLASILEVFDIVGEPK
jgi:hypothetical protein